MLASNVWHMVDIKDCRVDVALSREFSCSSMAIKRSSKPGWSLRSGRGRLVGAGDDGNWWTKCVGFLHGEFPCGEPYP